MLSTGTVFTVSRGFFGTVDLEKCRSLFLESPGNFSGPKSCFVFAEVAFKIKVSIILKMIQRKNQFTKQINRFVS